MSGSIERPWTRATKCRSSVRMPGGDSIHPRHSADEAGLVVCVPRPQFAVQFGRIVEHAEHVLLLGPMVEVAGRSNLIVGEKQPRLVDDVPVPRILERLGVPPREVEKVGGRVNVDAVVPDVGIEPKDQALVFAGLEARMLREPAAPVG